MGAQEEYREQSTECSPVGASLVGALNFAQTKGTNTARLFILSEAKNPKLSTFLFPLSTFDPSVLTASSPKTGEQFEYPCAPLVIFNSSYRP